MAVRFGLAPGVLLQRWSDGPGVVYAQATASTHLVSAEAAALLDAIAASPQGSDARGLARALESDAEPVDAAGLATLGDMLDGLVGSGLLRRLD